MTKSAYTPREQDYHDAWTYLRLMRRALEGYADPSIHHKVPFRWEYYEAKYEFDQCSRQARRAARFSLSMRLLDFTGKVTK